MKISFGVRVNVKLKGKEIRNNEFQTAKSYQWREGKSILAICEQSRKRQEQGHVKGYSFF